MDNIFRKSCDEVSKYCLLKQLQIVKLRLCVMTNNLNFSALTKKKYLKVFSIISFAFQPWSMDNLFPNKFFENNA